MKRLPLKTTACVCIAAVLLTGCHPAQPFYFHEDGDLSHYVGRAMEIEYPDVDLPSLPEVELAKAPLTLENADFDKVWELCLDEAIKIALSNGKVLKNLGARLAFDINLQPVARAPGDVLLANPDGAVTIYTPGLQETSAGLSGLPIGPEAALAAFDANVSASVLWQKTDRVNNFIGGQATGFIPQLFQIQDLASFQASVSKTAATGATLTFGNTTNYELNNNVRLGQNLQQVPPVVAGRVFPSDWRTNFQAELRQPLLQGAGVQFNRIAGPFNPITGVGTRNFDGVVLARIEADRSLADFEAGVRNLVADVVNVYWELYCTYRRLEARKVGMTSSLRTWQTAKALKDAEATGGGAEREALAREQYFSFVAQVKQAKSDIFSVENRLRFLMGLAHTDGRLIRPADDPTRAKVTLDWHDALGESLVRNVELRKQRWRVKQRELEIVAAKNHLLPRLDFVARQRWTGFGDQLIDPGDDVRPSPDPGADAFARRFDNAFETLLDGKFQEWDLGLEFRLSLGYRQELADLRNRQFLLARDKAVLREQENELSHLMADAVRDLAEQYELIETYFNQRVAAQTQVDTFQAKLEVGAGRGIEQLDLFLDAQRRLSQAEENYYNAVCAYNRAITQVHYRKGSLLEEYLVHLAEGPWPGKAYFDALRLARQRDASLYVNYGFTRPKVISRGPYKQNARPFGLPGDVELNEDGSYDAEEIPTPTPEDSEGSDYDESYRTTGTGPDAFGSSILEPAGYSVISDVGRAGGGQDFGEPADAFSGSGVSDYSQASPQSAPRAGGASRGSKYRR